MRWPWQRRSSKQRAAEAVAQAQERLDRVRAKDPEVNSLAERLREIRDSNHFAQLLETAFRQRRR